MTAAAPYSHIVLVRERSCKARDGCPYAGSKSLADLVRLGERLALSCLFCRHFARLDTAAMASLPRRRLLATFATTLPSGWAAAQAAIARHDEERVAGEAGDDHVIATDMVA